MIKYNCLATGYIECENITGQASTNKKKCKTKKYCVCMCRVVCVYLYMCVSTIAISFWNSYMYIIVYATQYTVYCIQYTAYSI